MAIGDEDGVNIEGAAPGGTGLLLIDVINPFNFKGAESLASRALHASAAILSLRHQADAMRVPVIYVNDNYGHWGSERSKLVGICAAGSPTAKRLVARLKPRSKDYFIIKPQFSGFYATNLPVLLPKLGINRIVLTGFASDICVLFTAADAHMREYDIWVPADAVASDDEDRSAWALDIMRNSMKANVEPTRSQSFAAWVRAPRRAA